MSISSISITIYMYIYTHKVHTHTFLLFNHQRVKQLLSLLESDYLLLAAVQSMLLYIIWYTN